MSFLYPAWLYCLISLPLLIAGAIIMAKNRAKVWSKFVSPRLQAKLVQRRSSRMRWLAFSFSLLGLALIITAMARPYYGSTSHREKIQTRNILIAVDTSLSMLCNDVSPNRLGSAKVIATRLVDQLPDDHIGIMAFSGTPNLITSLSIDHQSIKEAISSLDENSAHIRGSDLTDALLKGIETLRRSGKQANALILITDGSKELPKLRKITKLAKEAYVQIFSIGVGTEAGGNIPIKGGLHLDSHGRAVATKLEPQLLRQLAKATSGEYSAATDSPETTISNLIKSMKQYELAGRARQLPNELYQWFLASGLVFLIASALLKIQREGKYGGKRGLAAAHTSTTLIALSLCGIFLPLQAHAESSLWDDAKQQIFTNPAESSRGYRALKKENYPLAIKHLKSARLHTEGDEAARLSYAIGQAYYRLGQFSLAKKNFSKAMITSDKSLQIKAQYNLANSTFKSHTKHLKPTAGVPFSSYLEHAVRAEDRSTAMSNDELDELELGLENAITHYADTLAADPDFTSAANNKQAAQSLLKNIRNARKKVNKEKEEKEKGKKEKGKKEKEKEGKGKKEQKEKQDEKKGQDQKKKGEKGDNEKKGKKGKDTKGDKKEGKQTKSQKEQEEDKTKQAQQREGDGEKKKPSKALKPSDKKAAAKLTEDQQKALDLLRRHQDKIKKERPRSRWQRHPEIDW